MMKKPLTLKEFVKNNWILISVLAFVFVASLAIFIIVFWGEGLDDASVWSSLVAGIFTYLGSTFLGVVVFYNTQYQQRQKEIEDQIKINVSYYADYDDQSDYYYLFSESSIDKERFKNHVVIIGDISSETILDSDSDSRCYLKFSVTNWNTHIPLYINPVMIHCFSKEKKRETIKSFLVYSEVPDKKPLDFKQKNTFLLGINKELLDTDYYTKGESLKFFVVINLTDTNNNELYAVLPFIVGKTFHTGKPIFMTKKEYKENEKDYGFPAEPILSQFSIDHTYCQCKIEEVIE